MSVILMKFSILIFILLIAGLFALTIPSDAWATSVQTAQIDLTKVGSMTMTPGSNITMKGGYLTNTVPPRPSMADRHQH
jgi:hypothetical protein